MRLSLKDLRVARQQQQAAQAKALRDALDSLHGQTLQKIDCWNDEIIVLHFETGALWIESDTNLSIEVTK